MSEHVQDAVSRRVPRRMVLTGALATTGGVLVGGRAGAAPDGDPGFLDLSRADVRAASHWLTGRVDGDGPGDPVPLHLGTTGTAGQVSVASSSDLVGLAADSAAPAAATAAVHIGPGRPAVVWVTPRAVGRPGEPAGRVTVTGPEGATTVAVYAVPTGGRWEWAGLNGAPLDLQICAVHAAVLRGKHGNLEVEMYSPPRKTDAKGNPERNPKSTTTPQEWTWLPKEMVEFESRRLDLRTMTTAPRPMNVDLGDSERSENIFCSGQAHLADGRLLVAGSHVYHPIKNDPMKHARHLYVYDQDQKDGWRLLPNAVFAEPHWYPTVTQLPDGRMLLTSGAQNAPWTPNDFWNEIVNNYYILDPTTEQWVNLDGKQSAELVDLKQVAALRGADQRLATYPNIFVLPGTTDTDTIVAMVETNLAWLYTYKSGGGLTRGAKAYPMGTTGSRSYTHMGSAVVLPFGPKPGPMTILVMGGQHEKATDHRDLNPAQKSTDTAEIFVLDPAKTLTEQAGWQWVGKLAHARLLCDATLLADGGVLVSGGSANGWSDRNTNPVKQSELYDAASKKFRPAAIQRTDRRYHATALLLPNGSVLKAGSTGGFAESSEDPAKWFQSHTDAERYWPEYAYANRPRITAVSTGTAKHGGTLTLTVTGSTVDAKLTAAIVRLGAVTHNNNMDQRYVRLATTGHTRTTGDAWTVQATLPRNPAAAPGGDYYLLVVDRFGTPSPAETIRLTLP
jgi:hypothetical protein